MSDENAVAAPPVPDPDEKVQAALLDAQGLFQGMVEVERKDLGEDHLPQITECDLKPGEYRWVADAKNAMGGEFKPLYAEQRPGPAGVSLEAALADFLLAVWQRDPAAVPPRSLAWLNEAVRSIAVGGFPAGVDAAAFLAAQNLSKG